jgi:hypothetical protein
MGGHRQQRQRHCRGRSATAAAAAPRPPRALAKTLPLTIRSGKKRRAAVVVILEVTGPAGLGLPRSSERQEGGARTRRADVALCVVWVLSVVCWQVGSFVCFVTATRAGRSPEPLPRQPRARKDRRVALHCVSRLQRGNALLVRPAPLTPPALSTTSRGPAGNLGCICFRRVNVPVHIHAHVWL